MSNSQRRQWVDSLMESLVLVVLCFLPFLEHTCTQCILWVVEMLVSRVLHLQGIGQRAGNSLSLVGHLVRVLQKNLQKVESSSILKPLLLFEVERQLASVLFSGKIPATVKGLLEAPLGSVLAGEDL